MCLLYSEKETRLIKRRFAEAKKNDKNYITCYKWINLTRNDKIRTPLYNRVYKPGWNKSNRKSKEHTPNEFGNTYEKGIHLYSTLKKFLLYADTYYVACRCYEKDFVAGGEDGECLFMKVFITKKDYDEAVKRIVRRQENITND